MADERIKRPEAMQSQPAPQPPSDKDNTTVAPIEMDPHKYELFRQRASSEQNLVNGLSAGAVAALLGAGVWATVTALTGWQIGFMAIGIGFLVGYAVRTFGNGLEASFSIGGAALSLLGCALGNLLTIVYFISEEYGSSFGDVLAGLDMNLITEIMIDTAQPMDILFYGLAIYYGYKSSLRRITPEEMKTLQKS